MRLAICTLLLTLACSSLSRPERRQLGRIAGHAIGSLIVVLILAQVRRTLPPNKS